MEDNTSTNINPLDETAVPAPAPRRRGRPPKSSVPSQTAVPTEAAAPKRRGRPPKSAQQASLPATEPPAGAGADSVAKPHPVADSPVSRSEAGLFSFDPAEDAIGQRERENKAGQDNSQAGVAVRLNPAEIIANNKPALSPEKPPEKMDAAVYTPESMTPPELPVTRNVSQSGYFSDAQPASSEQRQRNLQPQQNDGNAKSGEWKNDRFAGRGDRWEKRNPQRFNPQDRNGNKGFQRFQPRDKNNAPSSASQTQSRENNNNGSAAQSQNGQRFPKREKFQAGKFNAQGKFDKFKERENTQRPSWGALANTDSAEEATLDLGNSFDYNKLKDETFLNNLKDIAKHVVRVEKNNAATGTQEYVPGEALPAPSVSETRVPCEPGASINFNEIYDLPMNELIERTKSFGIPVFRNPQRRSLIRKIMNAAFEQNRPVELSGTLELLANGHGLLLYTSDNFRVRELSAFVPSVYIKKFGLQRGHELSTVVHPPMPGETAPIVVEITSIMGTDPAEIKNLTPFTELTPYYPTERIMLETTPDALNGLSMRCVDLLCPIGLGQRGLIVAPPRVGKTVLLQTMANSILKNKPNAKLIVLLVDERPEEVTDFRRNTRGAEVISSTFDETAENHVHVAEMVIERSRRMVELGLDVIILLDSITRLARAYNTLMPNGGKVLSGGVEAGALAKPKRFFGSARNIEGGGSLTILGTALIDTGSKMDEVIFEEFKGTGNMELDLDRDLANKRIFPAINFERSGTRKEELLYHPDEMQYVYSMRRAMKGVPSIEAMEMLINRMKKTKTNIEFLMTLANR